MWISGTSDGLVIGSGPKRPAGMGSLDAERTGLVLSGDGTVAGEALEVPGALEFGRMVRLVRSNERLFAELRLSRSRIEETRAYLGRPDANRALGLARLERLRDRHSAILARLRANRVEGRQLLARSEEPLAEQMLLAC